MTEHGGSGIIKYYVLIVNFACSLPSLQAVRILDKWDIHRWAASRKKVPYGLSRCHTKRRIREAILLFTGRSPVLFPFIEIH